MFSADFIRKVTRRALLKSSGAGLAAMAIPTMYPSSDVPLAVRKGRIHQSVSRWCYRDLSVDQLSEYAFKIGLKGVDLLQPEEYETPRRYGLVCTMGYAGAGEIASALNDIQNHPSIEHGFRTNIP